MDGHKMEASFVGIIMLSVSSNHSTFPGQNRITSVVEK